MSCRRHILRCIYEWLLAQYGPQGWWPYLNHRGTSVYHPGDYAFPDTDAQRFQICAGAILTQNTAWTNVEKALTALNAQDALCATGLLRLSTTHLKAAIRPAGYFNTKADYLVTFARFYNQMTHTPPTRTQLLALRGIGPETADSILLYGFGQPFFVVDAYTRRIFSTLGVLHYRAPYADIQTQFCAAFGDLHAHPKIAAYQEYHALIVAHAKRFYVRQQSPSVPSNDPLKTIVDSAVTP